MNIYFYISIILLIALTVLIAFMWRMLAKRKSNSEIQQNAFDVSKDNLISEISKINEEKSDLESSVEYAKRLVDAIFKIGELVEFKDLDYFLFYKPKDIISGDFVFHDSKYDRHYFVVADCTGHGVPGAFMSIVSYNLFNQAINEFGFSDPAEILKFINEKHYEIFNFRKKSTIKDGMDVGVCVVDMDSEIIEYAGAMRPLYILREDGELEKISGDRRSIGGLSEENEDKFTTQVIDFNSGDCLYLTSDGYADQFGGERGKKFKLKQFKEMLLSFHGVHPGEQKKVIEKRFEEWKGDLEQVDDITILGIKAK